MKLGATANGKKNILSGSVPSGVLTIGNYIGAIKNWADLQEEYNCYYMVGDLHSLTTSQDPKILRERSLSFFAQYLACGLDPEKNCIFFQSHVPEHAELAWILGCQTSMGSLNRMTQFKDKSASHPKNINAGLFTYPVLMAADILLYDTHLVPVGEDQKQHLELTRDLVEHFNNAYGPTFVMPDPFIPKVGARIMSLQDPESKMSKSDPNANTYIGLLDDAKLITKKIKSAVTDSGTEVKFTAGEKSGINNLITIYSVLSGKSTADIEAQFAGKMYGHLKLELAELVCSTLAPVQAKYNSYMQDEKYLFSVMQKNAVRAREHAAKTLARVYNSLGLVK